MLQNSLHAELRRRWCIDSWLDIGRHNKISWTLEFRRLTLRCSGREKHKVHAAGVQRHRAHGRCRARVLERQWPAAELGS
jgi:hypothetical protein